MAVAYSAIVTRLSNVRKHPNADRLNLATVVGNQVVIRLDHQEGELGVYFPCDGQLSEKMCFENDLFSDPSLNKNKIKGYFDHNRRVKAQKFRGEKSDGLWLPLQSIVWSQPGIAWNAYKDGRYDYDRVWPEGTLITDELICTKYITRATHTAGQGTQGRKIKRGEALMFPKHYDTENFQYYWQDIPSGSIIYLTEKLHGTSGRYGRVLNTDFGTGISSIVPRLLNWCGYKWDHWTYLNGSRNVIIEQSNGNGYYGDDSFRINATKDIQLRKGETIFFELVGDVAPGSPIMPPVAVPKELSDTRQQYGPIITYNYGCNAGESKLFVYRIVQFNDDGYGTDLSWPQVKRRCKELGLNHVPELVFNPDYDTEMKGFIWPELDPYNDYRGEAYKVINELADGPSVLDPTHIREGVAIRVETPDGRIYCLKCKSFAFKVLEGITKLDDNYVDMEEAN